MRDIKFRGKSINTGAWVYGYFNKNRHGDCYIEDEDGLSTIVDSDSIGQFVCLDRDGVEVFEGDYLNYSDDWEDQALFLVVWDDADHTYSLKGISEGVYESAEVIDRCSVVGNIHDRAFLPEDILVIHGDDTWILGDMDIYKTPEEFVKAIYESSETEEDIEELVDPINPEQVDTAYYLSCWAFVTYQPGSVKCWAVVL